MTDIMIKTAEEEFLNQNFTAAYGWALSAKRLDPFYHSVDKYAEVYRVHWAAEKKKTPSGEIDWYGVLDIKDQLSISYRMITHKYVQLAKKIDPEYHWCVATPGANKLITTAWEILNEPQSRQDYHARAGLPPVKWEDFPQFPIYYPGLEEVNRAAQRELEQRQRQERQWEERQKEERQREKRQKEEPQEITVKKSSCAHKQHRKEQPEITVKKVSFGPNRHRQESREGSVEKFSCAPRLLREERREVTVRMVSCAQKRSREEGQEVIPKEFGCAPNRYRQESPEVGVDKFSCAPRRYREERREITASMVGCAQKRRREERS